MISQKLKIIIALFAVSTNGANLYKGIATLHETKAAGDGAQIRGSLTFTQARTGSGEYTVEVSGTLTGLPDGVHGFHIHQYGDESIDESNGKNRYGAHFVPTCKPPTPVDCGLQSVCPTAKPNPCQLMQTHGLPPDPIRQAGDMGNILVKKGEVKTILPAAFLEVQSGFGQSKMTLFDKDSSILGRAVAIHKFQDIGRHVPLDDGFCEPTCGIQTTENEKVYPKDGEGKLRACGTNTGKVKFDDLGIQDKILKHKVTQPAFASYRTSTKNVVARYPGQKVTGKPDVWYNVKIKQKPLAQSGLFEVQYDDAMACARRQSAHYLKATSQRTVFEVADPFGGAGPAIAGGIVGRMNPNKANDGITSTRNVDVTKPAASISEISCYMRAVKDAGDKSIGGEVLIVQTPLTKNVQLQAKLVHASTMGGKEYSFHFHDYGDLRLLEPADKDKRRVGQIYNEGKEEDIIKLKVLKIPQGKTKTVFAQKYTLPDNVKGVAEYVGRSLTIHGGPLKSSPTISYGVCGIANPDSRQQFTQTTIKYEEGTASTAAALGLSFISLLVALFW